MGKTLLLTIDFRGILNKKSPVFFYRKRVLNTPLKSMVYYSERSIKVTLKVHNKSL
jgi:hypothetical protein